MKLVIQIPCYNEEATLGLTLSRLPRRLAGISSIEWLVIDDGSHDKTVEVAKSHGVDLIIQLPAHQGLAAAFSAGIRAALERGADIIVNTDADNQYEAGDIDKLLQPILQRGAEMVIGTRQYSKIQLLPLYKRCLYRIASLVVSAAARQKIADPTSGFRAFHFRAARNLNIRDGYTYTLESIIQATFKGISIHCVPVRTNPVARPSRLIRSVPYYIFRSAQAIVRSTFIYGLEYFTGAAVRDPERTLPTLPQACLPESRYLG